MHANQLPRLALDPALPEPMAQLMRTHPHLLRMVRSGWKPRPFWPMRMPLLARTAGLLMIVTSLLILPVVAVDGGDGVNLDDIARALTIGLIFAGGFFALGSAAELLPSLSQVKVNRCLRYAYEHPNSFVLPEDLDAWTAPLLRRAQDAADAVLMSQINRRGMMDGTLNSIRLRDETWQIARRLAELTEVAADYTAIVGKDIPEEFAEAYRPYDETLRTSYASLTARVEALEDYAEKVRRADRHLEVYRNVERLREHTPRFEKLRAELVDDHLARPGTRELGIEIDEVERQLQESIEDARQAASYLLDPVPSSAVPPPRPATEPLAKPAVEPTAEPHIEPHVEPHIESASGPDPAPHNGHQVAGPTTGLSATPLGAQNGRPAVSSSEPAPDSPVAAPGEE
ncbi:hypothetical protein AB0K60_01495 [Thermopolyspora sp. NPDC052614]|uniref:hypothetical protein n=1 Tax=Thermopolyspora sp. NPDC052614 TaxID=3155682 RepID=UPI00341DA29C